MAVTRYELGINCGKTEVLGSRLFIEAGDLAKVFAYPVRIGESWATRMELGSLVARWGSEIMGRWERVAERLRKLIAEGGVEGASYVDMGFEGCESGVLLVGQETIGLTYMDGVLDIREYGAGDREGTSVTIFPAEMDVEAQAQFILTHKGTRSMGDVAARNREGTRVGVLKKNHDLGESGQVLGDSIEYYVGIDGVWFMNPHLSWSTIERNLSE